MFSSTLYRNSPITLQSGLISLRALGRKLLREGKQFERQLRELENVQHLSAADLAAHQLAKLGQLLTHAVQHVPFYKDLALQSRVADSQPIDALAAFPLIDKAVVREQGARFMAENAKRPLFKGSTSGTTGTPLVLHQDLEAINRENAFIWRQLEWAGFKDGDRRAWIRGDLAVPAEANSPPFWRMNRAENMLMFSSYHLSDNNAPAYVEALARFDPTIIQAFPSSITFLAKWLDANNRNFAGSALKGIVTSSETLNAEEKTLIEQRFGCRVFDWYGLFERVAAIGTCEHGRQHIISDYSFVELQPADDGLYEIVGSGFNNFAMPLIRYRTGDFVRVGDADNRCECGRHFPLVTSIHGRDDDMLKLPDGRHVCRLAFIFKDVEGILEGQIRQDRLDLINILVVPTAGYDPAVETKLLNNAQQRLGSTVRISVQVVSAIPRTKNGKLRMVVCNV